MITDVEQVLEDNGIDYFATGKTGTDQYTLFTDRCLIIELGFSDPLEIDAGTRLTASDAVPAPPAPS